MFCFNWLPIIIIGKYQSYLFVGIIGKVGQISTFVTY